MLVAVQLDDEQCYRAVQSKDSRFDGWFVTAVRTTGIYCRPSCPAITPKRANVEFFRDRGDCPAARLPGVQALPAGRQPGLAGVERARRRRRPGDAPDRRRRRRPRGRRRARQRLGYSTRQVNRLLVAELGCGPLALARAQRAQTARVLIETTTMPSTDIAFAAGFSSVRQFNDTVREVFAGSPTELRDAPRARRRGGRRRRARPAAAGPRAVRRRARCSTFLGDARRARRRGGRRRHLPARRCASPTAAAVVALTPGAGRAWPARCGSTTWPTLQAAVQRCRRLLDLDADPRGDRRAPRRRSAARRPRRQAPRPALARPPRRRRAARAGDARPAGVRRRRAHARRPPRRRARRAARRRPSAR